MAGRPNRGALAALGIAGLVWAYKNRDQLGAKLNEFRGQLSNSTSGTTSHQRSFDDRPFDSQTDIPGETRSGENYNTSI